METSNTEREISAARNQAMFRYVNEKILEVDAAFGGGDRCSIACECADVACVALVEIPRQAYEDVRKSPHTFAVLPEHVAPALERVVKLAENYTIVEVIGAGVSIAEETDPRREPSTTLG